MTGMRFLFVAVGTAAALWLAATAIGVSSAVLSRSAIVLGLAGVIVAGGVEALLKRRRARVEPGAPPPPSRAAGNTTAPSVKSDGAASSSVSSGKR
jgi:hypothetical protein